MKKDDIIEKKPINGYEGRYELDIRGGVYSVGRIVKNKYSNNILLKGRRLAQPLDKRGYPQVWLVDENGKGKCTRVHRLVALTYLPNPENKRTVNHINGIKTDNRVENLEWATDTENIRHSFKNGFHKGLKGDKNPMYGKRGKASPNFGKKGPLAPAYGKKGELASTAKLVLDDQTGIIYFGVPEAAFAKNIKPFTLYGKLNGRRKNDTSLRYI